MRFMLSNTNLGWISSFLTRLGYTRRETASTRIGHTLSSSLVQRTNPVQQIFPVSPVQQILSIEFCPASPVHRGEVLQPFGANFSRPNDEGSLEDDKLKLRLFF